MKKKFSIIGLDCANCANKAEAEANKIDGVVCHINFLTEKMTLEANDTDFKEKLELVKKAVAKVEPDCEIVD